MLYRKHFGDPSLSPLSRQLSSLCGHHLYRHMKRVHSSWYLDPASAGIDCHTSAGTERDLRNVHKMHQLVIGETLIRGWFLIMNGLLLFLNQEIGLGSPIDNMNINKFYVLQVELSLADCSSLPDGCPTLKREIIDTHFQRDKLPVNR